MASRRIGVGLAGRRDGGRHPPKHRRNGNVDDPVACGRSFQPGLSRNDHGQLSLAMGRSGHPAREEKTMSNEQTDGKAKEIGGSIKEKAGKLTGNDRMEAEGTGDRVEGKTEKNIGKAKDAVKDQFS
ncbi:CsbD family protein [Aurantimonas aggregata]|nr:CsbD family protein [Aurantimonas aggregata]